MAKSQRLEKFIFRPDYPISGLKGYGFARLYCTRLLAHVQIDKLHMGENLGREIKREGNGGREMVTKVKGKGI